jgi:hypothetical protein
MPASINPTQLLQDLQHFYGTEQWYRFNPLYRNFLLTDGTKYLAEKAGAYWFTDLIASYQTQLLRKQEWFQVWNIKVSADRSAQVWCDDGNGKALVTQDIPFTDFPLSEFSLYAEFDGENLVILLKSEH